MHAAFPAAALSPSLSAATHHCGARSSSAARSGVSSHWRTALAGGSPTASQGGCARPCGVPCAAPCLNLEILLYGRVDGGSSGAIWKILTEIQKVSRHFAKFCCPWSRRPDLKETGETKDRQEKNG